MVKKHNYGHDFIEISPMVNGQKIFDHGHDSLEFTHG